MKDLETVVLTYSGHSLVFKFTGEMFHQRHNIGPKKFEELVKSREEAKRRPIIRGDHKNKMPDWCSYTRSEFIECKQSDVAKNAKDVFRTWVGTRTSQVKSFIDLYHQDSLIPIRIKFAIHAGNWVTFWDLFPKKGKG